MGGPWGGGRKITFLVHQQVHGEGRSSKEANHRKTFSQRLPVSKGTALQEKGFMSSRMNMQNGLSILSPQWRRWDLDCILHPYPFMTMCIIPLGINHLPARKQHKELHKGVGSFDWVNLTLALKGYYIVPVKDHVCPRKFCLPRSLHKACNSSWPFYVTIQQSSLQELRWLHSTKLP